MPYSLVVGLYIGFSCSSSKNQCIRLHVSHFQARKTQRNHLYQYQLCVDTNQAVDFSLGQSLAQRESGIESITKGKMLRNAEFQVSNYIKRASLMLS